MDSKKLPYSFFHECWVIAYKEKATRIIAKLVHQVYQKLSVKQLKPLLSSGLLIGTKEHPGNRASPISCIIYIWFY